MTVQVGAWGEGKDRKTYKKARIGMKKYTIKEH